MKKNIYKILLLISTIIIILGIILYFNATIFDIDNTNSNLFIVIFSILGNVSIKLLIILITFAIVLLIWLIYAIVLLCKKIRNKKIKIFLILFLIIIIIFSLFLLKPKKYDYYIRYENGMNIYDIYKYNDKVTVYANEQVYCIKDPCPNIKDIREVNFSNKNMRIINNFIDSFFLYIDYNGITINDEQLNEEQNNILKSIIYNDESYLNNI